MKKVLFLVLVLILSISTLSAQVAEEGIKKETVKKEKGVEGYLSDLSSKDSKIVQKACEWFAKNEKKEGVPKMIDLLASSDESIRLHSSINLGYLADETSVNPLISQLEKESSADVRYAIVLAITRIGLKEDEQKKRLLALKSKEKDPIILDYIKKMEEKLK